MGWVHAVERAQYTLLWIGLLQALTTDTADDTSVVLQKWNCPCQNATNDQGIVNFPTRFAAEIILCVCKLKSRFHICCGQLHHFFLWICIQCCCSTNLMWIWVTANKATAFTLTQQLSGEAEHNNQQIYLLRSLRLELKSCKNAKFFKHQNWWMALRTTSTEHFHPGNSNQQTKQACRSSGVEAETQRRAKINRENHRPKRSKQHRKTEPIPLFVWPFWSRSSRILLEGFVRVLAWSTNHILSSLDTPIFHEMWFKILHKILQNFIEITKSTPIYYKSTEHGGNFHLL